jgi:hypothetical protein
VSGVRIQARADIPEALGRSVDQGGLMLDESAFGPDFFDLRTGLAGELFQKFTQYRAKLAIVVADDQSHGVRFGELIFEHRTHPDVRFFSSEQLARQWLSYNPVTRC